MPDDKYKLNIGDAEILDPWSLDIGQAEMQDPWQLDMGPIDMAPQESEVADPWTIGFGDADIQGDNQFYLPRQDSADPLYQMTIGPADIKDPWEELRRMRGQNSGALSDRDLARQRQSEDSARQYNDMIERMKAENSGALSDVDRRRMGK